MSKYFKFFEDHENYEDFTETEEFIKPNVSYCENQNEVHYNPFVIPTIRCIFNITTANADVMLTYGEDYMNNNFDRVIIDGTTLERITTGQNESYADESGYIIPNTYRFTTTGNHTVEFVLKNEAEIGQEVFYSDGILGVTQVVSIEIPATVTSIGGSALYNQELAAVYFNSTTVPNYSNANTLFDANTTIYVPASAVNDYQTAWSSYSSNITARP